MTAGRSIFLGSLLVSLVLALLLIPRDAQTFTLVLVALGVVTAAGSFAPARADRALLSLAVLNLLTVAPELALRAANFSYASGVQFGYPTPEEFWEFVPDEDLFWLLPVEDPKVNSLGFWGEEPEVPKPDGLARLLFLGDSCSQQGYPESYPDIVEHLLRQNGLAVDAVNLSMAGYGTHQGRALAERHGPALEPDAVVVYYGWNDHWLAYGAVDRDKPGSLRKETLYRRSRLLQLLRRLAVSSGVKRDAAALESVRVPAPHYRENLEAIVARFDVPVVLVTAPSSHRELGVPDYLVAKGFARDKGTVVALHAQYNAIVREVAHASGAHLLDLDALFQSGEDLRAAFTEDGIHLTEAGRWALARRVEGFLRANELLTGERP